MFFTVELIQFEPLMSFLILISGSDTIWLQAMETVTFRKKSGVGKEHLLEIRAGTACSVVA